MSDPAGSGDLVSLDENAIVPEPTMESGAGSAEPDDDDALEKLKEQLRALDAESAGGAGASGGARDAAATEIDARSVYIGNVDYACKPEELANTFSTCGSVRRVTVCCHPNGHPKGYAYMETDSPETAERCVALCNTNPPVLHGRTLKVRCT
eukprot:TRINITY_DN3308_c0_g1_i2.p1 TRINITY_DN3308_c0_g1~~TRINITY_DN3308_c0_g1_i2.p1  ORF type:complete len:152 (+),score=11.71 TRINITY_DN3308_c0_g1_i2:230-685(+)